MFSTALGPAPLKLAPRMSFPRKRESIGLTMGPRFRGDDDADFHFLLLRVWPALRGGNPRVEFPGSFQRPISAVPVTGSG